MRKWGPVPLIIQFEPEPVFQFLHQGIFFHDLLKLLLGIQGFFPGFGLLLILHDHHVVNELAVAEMILQPVDEFGPFLLDEFLLDIAPGNDLDGIIVDDPQFGVFEIGHRRMILAFAEFLDEQVPAGLQFFVGKFPASISVGLVLGCYLFADGVERTQGSFGFWGGSRRFCGFVFAYRWWSWRFLFNDQFGFGYIFRGRCFAAGSSFRATMGSLRNATGLADSIRFFFATAPLLSVSSTACNR